MVFIAPPLSWSTIVPLIGTEVSYNPKLSIEASVCSEPEENWTLDSFRSWILQIYSTTPHALALVQTIQAMLGGHFSYLNNKLTMT